MGLDEIDLKLNAQKKKISISITIDPLLNKEFTILAKELKFSKSKIIEELIIAYMDNKKVKS